MDDWDSSESIVKYFKLSHEMGLNTLMGGNASIRVGNRVLITPTNMPKTELDEEDLVEIDIDGNVIRGNKKPSTEWRMHVEIYKATDYGAVFHAHPPNVLAMSSAGIMLDRSFSELKSYAHGIAVVPYIEPGTQELAVEVAKAIAEGNDLVILEKHGAVAVAQTIPEAFNKMEVLEMVAYVTLHSKLLQR